MKKGIAKKISIARNLLEISQEELANKLKTSRATIISWESGKAKPGSQSLEKLAKALNKPVAYFFEEEINHGDLRYSTTQEKSNSLTLPLIECTEKFPEYEDWQIEGYIQVPRHLYPGAELIAKCCGVCLSSEIRIGDLCVVRRTENIVDGKIMIIKENNHFAIKRLHEKYTSNGLKIIGQILGVWKKL